MLITALHEGLAQVEFKTCRFIYFSGLGMEEILTADSFSVPTCHFFSMFGLMSMPLLHLCLFWVQNTEKSQVWCNIFIHICMPFKVEMAAEQKIKTLPQHRESLVGCECHIECIFINKGRGETSTSSFILFETSNEKPVFYDHLSNARKRKTVKSPSKI